MATITEANLTIHKSTLSSGYKEIIVETPATADDGADFSISLPKYGIAADGFRTIQGYVHSTDTSIVAQEDPTTVVSSGTLAVTLGSVGGTDKRRVFIIRGLSG